MLAVDQAPHEVGLPTAPHPDDGVRLARHARHRCAPAGELRQGRGMEVGHAASMVSLRPKIVLRRKTVCRKVVFRRRTTSAPSSAALPSAAGSPIGLPDVEYLSAATTRLRSVEGRKRTSPPPRSIFPAASPIVEGRWNVWRGYSSTKYCGRNTRSVMVTSPSSATLKALMVALLLPPRCTS